MSSTLGGVTLIRRVEVGNSQSLKSHLAGQGLDPSSHMPHCSRLQSRVRILVDGSLRLQATQPDDAGCYTCVPSNGLLHPPSASAYLTVLCKLLTPASPTACSLPLGQAKPLSPNLPLLSPRPSPGDSYAS